MQFKQLKKIIILGLIMVTLVRCIAFWSPESEQIRILKRLTIINLSIVIIAAFFIPAYFQYRYRTLIAMLKHIAQAYNQPPLYSYTPVSVIKRQLYNTDNGSYLRKHDYKINAQSTLLIVHDGQEYDFYHYLSKKSHSEDLASVLIYLLKQGVPYELLYEHSKTIHTAL